MKPVLIAAVVLAAAPAGAAPFRLEFLGSTAIPTGTVYDGVEFGGISGLDRAADGTFYAISDNRGGESRGNPRFFTMDFDVSAGGLAATITGRTDLQRPDGTLFPADARTVDPEGVRLAPNGNLYWSSEGNFSTTPAQLFQPFVREMTTDGEFVRAFDTPDRQDYVDGATTGARNNKSFEALTVAPDGTLWVANEDALVQDGPLTTLTGGSFVRVTRLDPLTGLAGAEYAYALPPIPVDAAPGAPFGPDNGLPEMLALDDDSFLMVERAFAFGVGNTIRITLAELAGATDVSGIAALDGAAFTPMTRELILEMPITFEGVRMDNIEAIAWGDPLADGSRTLIIGSDNNFSGGQTTQFLAFRVAPVPLPAAGWLLVGALAALGFARRR